MAVISGATTVSPSLTPDLPGTFVVQLVVNDGTLNSEPSTVQVQAASSASAAVQAIQRAQADIAALDRAVFKNGNMRNALLNKLNAVIASVEAGRYTDALEQLDSDILGKTNGCASGAGPDKNDWILDCAAQRQVREDILLAALLVRDLM